MDSRIGQLHASVLTKMQLFHLIEHANQIIPLLTQPELTLDDITDRFKTIAEEKKSKGNMAKPTFLDSKGQTILSETSAAAYDIALKIEKLLILRHFAELDSKEAQSKRLESKKVIEKNYLTEITRVLKDKETTVKEFLKKENNKISQS